MTANKNEAAHDKLSSIRTAAAMAGIEIEYHIAVSLLSSFATIMKKNAEARKRQGL
jgi:hypothetical protein